MEHNSPPFPEPSGACSWSPLKRNEINPEQRGHIMNTLLINTAIAGLLLWLMIAAA